MRSPQKMLKKMREKITVYDGKFVYQLVGCDYDCYVCRPLVIEIE
jgi:hypothetical protein